MNTIAFRIRQRLSWYRSRFQVNNPVVGRAVEMFGNRVKIDGLTYSVETPHITTGHKSTLLFGLHEIEERELIRRWLPLSIPVIEFGGGLGVVSCLTNKRLSDPRQHVVVEANPAMIPILERNRDLNECKFTIVNEAIAYGTDTIDLNIDGEFVGSTVKNITTGATTKVRTTSITQQLERTDFKQVGIICDIEGAEYDVIKNEFPALGNRIRYLMVEMHPALLGEDTIRDLLEDLISLGFVLNQRIGDCVFLSR